MNLLPFAILLKMLSSEVTCLLSTRSHTKQQFPPISHLCSISITSACRILLDAIAHYPKIAHDIHVEKNIESKLTDREYSWEKIVGNYLSEYENSVFAVLRQHHWHRMVLSKSYIHLNEDRNTAASQALISHAVALPHSSAMSFFATLSGAWVLSYPESYIRQSSYLERYFGQRATGDHEYIFMLSSLLIEHGTAWMR